MPANLIIGFGRDPDQKKQTEAAEEAGSTELQPMGLAKKRRDVVRDILTDFIKIAERRMGSDAYRRNLSPSAPKGQQIVMVDRTLADRLEVAKQMQINMGMTGTVPSKLELQKISYQYYYDDNDDRDE